MKKLVFFIMSIVLIVLLCSCATFDIRGQFTQTKPIVCIAPPAGYGIYQENENKQCNLFYPIWFYWELKNITVKNGEYGKHYYVGFDIEILDIKDRVVFARGYDERMVLLQKHLYTDNPKETYFWYMINPAHPQLHLFPGDYTLRVRMKDLYSGEISETNVDFTIITRQSYYEAKLKETEDAIKETNRCLRINQQGL